MIKLPALTVWNPWAALLVFGQVDITLKLKEGSWDSLAPHGCKDIENRCWTPPHWLIGQRLVIHAGKAFDNGYVLPEGYEFDQYLNIALQNGLYAGCMLGTVQLDGYVRMVSGAPSVYPRGLAWSGSVWWDENQTGWIVSDPKPFPKPIVATGKQKVWYADVPDHFMKEAI